MKVVIDSNVLVAAFAARGLCTSVLELCLTVHTIIISDFILNEVRRTLIKKIKMSENDVQAIIDYLKNTGIIADYNKLKENICRDKNDDNILALALDSGAECIISGDKDLLALKKYKNIKITSPREFWEIAGKN